MQRTSISNISRKARIWPEISKEVLSLPTPPTPPTKPLSTMLITALVTSIGIIGIEIFLVRTGIEGSFAAIIPLAALSGIMAISTIITFFVQLINHRKRTKQLINNYRARLEETEKQLQVLQWKEQQSGIDLYPPLVLPPNLPAPYENLRMMPLLNRPLDDSDIGLWARRQIDPDFLQVRIGMGKQKATFQIRSNTSIDNFTMKNSNAHELMKWSEYAQGLNSTYESVMMPSTIKLDSGSPVAIVGSQQRLSQARELTRAMVGQLAYHHSPEDVRIIVLAPQSQENAWQWTTGLPHSIIYDPLRSNDTQNEVIDMHAVAIGTEAVAELLPRISRELARRELLLGDARPSLSAPAKTALLPHLVIIIDHFDREQDLDLPTQLMPVIAPGQQKVRRTPNLSVSPLKKPELTLALNGNMLLGVSVVCVCASFAEVPTSCGILIDLDTPTLSTMPAEATPAPTTPAQALIRKLQPDPPPSQTCELLDLAPIGAVNFLAAKLYPLRVADTKRLEIRTQVDIRMLFEPELELEQYEPATRWSSPAFRTMHPTRGEIPTMRVPIGLKVGDEVQYLDFIKDGPHGLLIGQTGSGKSELLQTIITSLAISYRPTEVNFLLIDYKAGLALEPFRHLPHTIGFLSNASSPALIQRFITMLKAEAIRREMQIKTQKNLPRLIIIIDEFAEMAKRTETVLEELFTITRVGRELGMHLLLAAQRPEGIIGSKVRDYVQYRLCLRCASPEDSREVLRRVDAANLPASIPGRGFLLHGDNQLDLFQSARVALHVTIPVSRQNTNQFKPSTLTPLPFHAAEQTATLAEIIIEKINTMYTQDDARKQGIIFWPQPLPTPQPNQTPDPLTLFRSDEIYLPAPHTSPIAPINETGQQRNALIPMSILEVTAVHGKHKLKPSMQIPIGLIDKPETQTSEIFQVDLHGSEGALTGGPLLIIGAQHSGKATALETMLFWLMLRYTPQQFRCIIIDPLHELDIFQDMPHCQTNDGQSLWTDGSTDESIKQLVEVVNGLLAQRREHPHIRRWDNDTLGRLWDENIEMPQLLLVMSNFHTFAERPMASMPLKKLALAMMESRTHGAYLAITAAEIGARYIPTDLMTKFSTRIGLFLNEQQRMELFGRTAIVPEPIPGRGLALTPDRSIHQVQIALATAGATENERREILKQELARLRNAETSSYTIK